MAYPRQSWAKNPLEETDMDGIAGVLAAANKYQFLVVERLVIKMLDAPALLDAHPYRVFAIAKLRALSALARMAAFQTLESPASPPPIAFPEMELLPWSTGQKMHDFHRQCGAAACEMAKKTAIWITPEQSDSPLYRNNETQQLFIWWERKFHTAGKCSVRPSDGEHLPAQWFQNHIKSLASQLRASPAAATVAVEALRIEPAERTMIEVCRGCSGRADSDLANFARQLEKRVEASNVSLGKSLNYFSAFLTLIGKHHEAKKML
jgi:hypothetical protein